MGQLRRSNAVFMSAGVPDPSKQHFLGEGDSTAIAAAVSALLYVTLGRRHLVWGGHPAITPMVWSFAERMDVDYGSWVQLYQSLFFQNDFPEETALFKNVEFTERRSDLAASVKHMRERMFSESSFESAVFIGGMGGIVEEFRMLRDGGGFMRIIPLTSTGGATRVLAEEFGEDVELQTELDYVDLLHRRLGVHPNERRYRFPQEQPLSIDERIERPQRRPPVKPGR